MNTHHRPEQAEHIDPLFPPSLPQCSAALMQGNRTVHEPLSKAKGISRLFDRSVREVGAALDEILDTAALMRSAYEDGELTSVQDRLRILQSRTSDLSSSVSELIGLSRLEDPSFRVKSERFDVVAVLREVAEAGRSLAGSKVITVMDASCPNPVEIVSDRSIIKQLLLGLVSNAVKSTERGRVALILARDDDSVRLTVADTGRGMSPEQVRSVLATSEKLHEGNAADFSATRGITISVALAKKISAGISIASRMGEGTIVEVTLPVQATLRRSR
jgi:signal transduction histidine kinase